MKTLVIFSSLYILINVASAQSLKIIRVQGTKAIVEFTGVQVSEGKIYNLENSSDLKLSPNEKSQKIMLAKRKYLIEIFGGISKKSTTTGLIETSGTIIDVNSRFGFNYSRFEFGPAIKYNNDSRLEVNSTTLAAGGFFEYNFVHNSEGVPATYGVGFEGLVGTMKLAGVSGISYRELYPYGFYKWFVNSNAAALTMKLGHSLTNKGTNPEIEEKDVKLGLGLALYF